MMKLMTNAMHLSLEDILRIGKNLHVKFRILVTDNKAPPPAEAARKDPA